VIQESKSRRSPRDHPSHVAMWAKSQNWVYQKHRDSRPINLQEEKDEWTLAYRIRLVVHLSVAKVHHEVTIAHGLDNNSRSPLTITKQRFCTYQFVFWNYFLFGGLYGYKAVVD